MKEEEMGRACSTHGRDGKCIQRKPEAKIQLLIHNIRMDV
jgi:hypothetical protein